MLKPSGKSLSGLTLNFLEFFASFLHFFCSSLAQLVNTNKQYDNGTENSGDCIARGYYILISLSRIGKKPQLLGCPFLGASSGSISC